ncbi:hypothetical protein T484DRAFT_1893695 [Baffinella frigidus]|nr:hypothetical protein T484DRAFT_1893695 [Cryptophyta sp. CCMP2293]
MPRTTGRQRAKRRSVARTGLLRNPPFPRRTTRWIKSTSLAVLESAPACALQQLSRLVLAWRCTDAPWIWALPWAPPWSASLERSSGRSIGSRSAAGSGACCGLRTPALGRRRGRRSSTIKSSITKGSRTTLDPAAGASHKKTRSWCECRISWVDFEMRFWGGGWVEDGWRMGKERRQRHV